MKTNIKVNMTGEEYMKYKQSMKIKFSKGTKRAIPFFAMAIIGAVFLSIFIGSGSFLTDPKPTTPIFNTWYNDLIPLMKHDTSWHGIFKISFIYIMPWLAVAIGIAWIIHGVGFVVIKR